MAGNLLLQNLNDKHVLPTLASPMIIILNTRFDVKCPLAGGIIDFFVDVEPGEAKLE